MNHSPTVNWNSLRYTKEHLAFPREEEEGNSVLGVTLEGNEQHLSIKCFWDHVLGSVRFFLAVTFLSRFQLLKHNSFPAQEAVNRSGNPTGLGIEAFLLYLDVVNWRPFHHNRFNVLYWEHWTRIFERGDNVAGYLRVKNDETENSFSLWGNVFFVGRLFKSFWWSVRLGRKFPIHLNFPFLFGLIYFLFLFQLLRSEYSTQIIR